MLTTSALMHGCSLVAFCTLVACRRSVACTRTHARAALCPSQRPPLHRPPVTDTAICTALDHPPAILVGPMTLLVPITGVRRHQGVSTGVVCRLPVQITVAARRCRQCPRHMIPVAAMIRAIALLSRLLTAVRPATRQRTRPAAIRCVEGFPP